MILKSIPVILVSLYTLVAFSASSADQYDLDSYYDILILPSRLPDLTEEDLQAHNNDFTLNTSWNEVPTLNIGASLPIEDQANSHLPNVDYKWFFSEDFMDNINNFDFSNVPPKPRSSIAKERNRASARRSRERFSSKFQSNLNRVQHGLVALNEAITDKKLELTQIKNSFLSADCKTALETLITFKLIDEVSARLLYTPPLLAATTAEVKDKRQKNNLTFEEQQARRMERNRQSAARSRQRMLDKAAAAEKIASWLESICPPGRLVG